MKRYVSLLFTAGLMTGCSGGGSGGGSSTTDTVPSTNSQKIVYAAKQALSTSGAEFQTPSLLNTVKKAIVNTLGTDPCPGFGSSQDETLDAVACMLTTNSKSPETALGTMHLLSEIIKGIELTTELTFPSSAADAENLSMTVNTADGDTDAVISITQQEVMGDFNQQLDICVISFDGQSTGSTLTSCKSSRYHMTVFFNVATESGAFKFVNRMDTEGYEVVAFSLDGNTGHVNFETWNYKNKFHTRYFVAGDISATNYAMSDIYDAKFAHYRGNADGSVWSSVLIDYEYGTDDSTEALCGNYKTGNSPNPVVDTDYSVGACSTTINYDNRFHDFGTFKTQFENDFANDPAAGYLIFDKSNFSPESFFIGQVN